MHSIGPPAKLLVTGASGFVAAHVCRVALEHGYDVLGAVRSKSKGDYLVNLFHNHGQHFNYVIVEDMVKTGAFDEAVKTVDAVLHTASPFHFKTNDPKELIDPAIHGTTGILESIFRNGPNVKRVIITSSIAAIQVPKDPPFTFTEKDWNTYSTDLVEKEGKDTPPVHQYQASKTLAERAAWEFVEEKKGEIKFDLVSINPSWVFGPTIHEVKEPSALNESVRLFWETISKPQPKEMLAASGFNFVDVRDVALAHIRGLDVPAAGGERFTLNMASFTFQQFYDILRDAEVKNVPQGHPGCDKDTKFIYHDGSKAERVLGFKYIDTKDTVIDTLQSVRKRFPETNELPVQVQQ